LGGNVDVAVIQQAQTTLGQLGLGNFDLQKPLDGYLIISQLEVWGKGEASASKRATVHELVRDA
jgi:hypothetical protein